jgi:hypothetical protein
MSVLNFDATGWDPATRTYAQLNPYEGATSGLTGAGVYQYIDPYSGEWQAVPYTGTPPLGPGQGTPSGGPGEAPLETSDYGGETDPYAAYDGELTGYDYMGAGAIPQDQQAQLHAQIHGVGQPRGYILEEWVNPANPGVPNLGPPNEQANQNGRTAITRHISSEEAGFLLDPAVWPSRFPHVEDPNPRWNMGQFHRYGQYKYLPEMNLEWGSFTGLAYELQFAERKMASAIQAHRRISDIPPSVPYSATVPQAGQAGPYNLVPVDTEQEAIYE